MVKRYFGNGIIQPRLKGLSGPFFEHYYNGTLIHTTGNSTGASAFAVTYLGVVVTKDAVEVTYT